MTSLRNARVWNDQDFLQELVGQGYTVGWPYDYTRKGTWVGLRVMTKSHGEASRLQEHIWTYRHSEDGGIWPNEGPMIIRETSDGRLAVRHITGCPIVTKKGWKTSYAIVTIERGFVYDAEVRLSLNRLLRKKELVSEEELMLEDEFHYMHAEFPHF